MLALKLEAIRPDPAPTPEEPGLDKVPPDNDGGQSNTEDVAQQPSPQTTENPWEHGDIAAVEADLEERREEEREKILKQAYEEGYKTGLEDVQERFAKDLAAMESLLESLRSILVDGIVEQEDLIVEIVYEAVGKILGEAVRRKEGVLALVQQVMRDVQEREQLVLRLAPADYELLSSGRASLGYGEIQGLELLADDRVVLGGCLVESAGGTLDGRLETQLQRLREVLLRAREASGEGSAG